MFIRTLFKDLCSHSEGRIFGPKNLLFPGIPNQEQILRSAQDDRMWRG